jgi:single-strand DNA-binding protein
MASLNDVKLIGNLTRDPQVRYTPGGSAVCDLGVAVNEKYKDKEGNVKEDTIFVDCTCWGRTAEFAGEYLSKGGSVFIEGKLKMESWQDAKTNEKREKMKVNVLSLQSLTPRQQ